MKFTYYPLIFIFLAGIVSCKKSWLDAKPDLSLVVPTTLKDLQSILDNTTIFNSSVQPAIGEIGSDNYFVASSTLPGLLPIERNSYLWMSDITEGASLLDWSSPYKQVNYANIALEGLDKINLNASNQVALNTARGCALFYRGFAFYSLAQLFCKTYDSATADADLGIPLRLSSDINKTVGRGTIQQAYNQIIQDLENASILLPISHTTNQLYRPTRPAAFAMLARTYLTMGDNLKAALYADSCLQLKNDLQDYNSLNSNASAPITSTNQEILFRTTLINYRVLTVNHNTDTNLYRSYQTNDLRKNVFFNSNSPARTAFKGNYTGSSILFFGGLAVDEVYLTRAEAKARIGDINAAMNDLNALLVKRWKTGTFVAIQAADQADAINKILIERRKELLFRGIRWIDLRRLNNKGTNITLTRGAINGQTISLAPNDIKYIYPIPNNEILYSGIAQNPR